MWRYQNTDELYHHGVIGMKWGVRRYQNADGSLTKAGKRKRSKMSADAFDAKLIKKKKVKQMSNAELRRLNERQQLERNNKQLNKNAIAKGTAAVATTAAALGSVILLHDNTQKLAKIGKKILWDHKYKQLKIKM